MKARLAPLAALAALAAAAPARAADWGWRADAYNRLTVERNLYDPATGRFEDDDVLYSFLADLTLEAALSEHWSASLTLDTGELGERTIDGGRLENDSERDFFVREAYVEYKDKALRLALGKQPVVVGRSYILDDFHVAADVRRRLPKVAGLRPYAGAGAAIVEDLDAYAHDAPILVTARLGADLAFFDRLEAFGAWLSDRGGLVGEGIEREVFGRNLRVLGLDLDSTGDLFWFGGEGETLVGPVSLSGVFIWQQGKVRLDGFGVSADGTPLRVDARVKTEGFLFDAEAAYGVLDGLFVRAWLLMASGNDGEFGDVARGRTYRSFLGITPYITRTNLFFNGGISSALSTRTFSVSGTEGRGFIVPGLTVSWEPLDALYLEYTFAYLRSAEGRAAPGSGRVYGYENDLEASWRPLDWLTLSAEFDHLSTGDFYERAGLPSPRDAWRFVVGADIHL